MIAVKYPHIIVTAKGGARLQNHPRIRVSQIVMDYLAHGWSAEEMCRQHLYLSPAEAHAAMSYYYDHQEQLDKEIARDLQVFEQCRKDAKPSPFEFRLRSQGRPIESEVPVDKKAEVKTQ